MQVFDEVRAVVTGEGIEGLAHFQSSYEEANKMFHGKTPSIHCCLNERTAT